MEKATLRNGDRIVWQQVEEGIAEPAPLLQKWSDTVSIEQEGRNVLINTDTIPHLVKWLQAAYKEAKK